jgi:YD repeat-containing protein
MRKKMAMLKIISCVMSVLFVLMQTPAYARGGGNVQQVQNQEEQSYNVKAAEKQAEAKQSVHLPQKRLANLFDNAPRIISVKELKDGAVLVKKEETKPLAEKNEIQKQAHERRGEVSKNKKNNEKKSYKERKEAAIERAPFQKESTPPVIKKDENHTDTVSIKQSAVVVKEGANIEIVTPVDNNEIGDVVSVRVVENSNRIERDSENREGVVDLPAYNGVIEEIVAPIIEDQGRIESVTYDESGRVSAVETAREAVRFEESEIKMDEVLAVLPANTRIQLNTYDDLKRMQNMIMTTLDSE